MQLDDKGRKFELVGAILAFGGAAVGVILGNTDLLPIAIALGLYITNRVNALSDRTERRAHETRVEELLEQISNRSQSRGASYPGSPS